MKMIIIVLFLSSCSFTSSYLQSGAKKYAKTNPEKIEIYATEKISQKYRVIGSVYADVSSGEMKDAVAMIREKAAKLGADAIIKSRLFKMTSIGRAGINGVAVKFIR